MKWTALLKAQDSEVSKFRHASIELYRLHVQSLPPNVRRSKSERLVAVNLKLFRGHSRSQALIKYRSKFHLLPFPLNSWVGKTKLRSS